MAFNLNNIFGRSTVALTAAMSLVSNFAIAGQRPAATPEEILAKNSEPKAAATVNAPAPAVVKLPPPVEGTSITVPETGKTIKIPVKSIATLNNDDEEAGEVAASAASLKGGYRVIKIHSRDPKVMEEMLGVLRGYVRPAHRNDRKLGVLFADGDQKSLVIYSEGLPFGDPIAIRSSAAMSVILGKMLDATYGEGLTLVPQKFDR